MKLNKYIWLVAMPMLFAACQNDTLGEELQLKNGIYTLCTSNQHSCRGNSRKDSFKIYLHDF